MSDISKQQQAAVAAHQNAQQQQTGAQMQQQVDGQTIQVQLTHDGSDQMHQQGNQVASSNATMNQTSTMVMATPQQALLPQQAMQNLQSPPALAPIHSQAGSTTITTMSTGPPQQMADWPGHGRVQVIQQPIQNPTYIQPVYNAQGQLIVPGNIALHPGNMNQPIQVIAAAGKPFQPGQMPHMLTTTQGKQIVQGQTASFPGYATIPTSGNNQTLVISQLGVLGQTNLLPQQQNKPQEMQKMITKTNVNNNMKTAQTQQQNVSIGNLVSSQAQGITTQAQTIIQPQIISPIQYTCNTQQPRAVPQGATQAMQFAPWQATFGPTGLPQGLTWAPGAIQGSALLTQGSQIFIRNPQPDQTGMFIQNPQPATMTQHTQMPPPQQVNKATQGVEMNANVQSKTAIPKTFSTILPNSIGPPQIRAASGVSTQTGQTQTTGLQTNFQAIKAGPKIRAKSVCRLPTITTAQKADAANQTKVPNAVHVIQPKLVLSNITPGSPGNLPQDPKLVKPGQNLQGNQQQTPSQQSQPLAQIQQMQNIFQEPMEQKPQPSSLMMSNGIPNGGDRVMPVVSMPPGQMTSIMGNMIVQTVPGIATMAPSIAIPTGQPVQNVPVPQEVATTPNTAPPAPNIKQEISEEKEAKPIVENGVSLSTPTRLGDDNSSSSEESTTAAESEPKTKDATEEGPEKSTEEKKDKKDSEKKNCDKEQPKAMMMVKPQVLTHVIEGFVIQESSEPFPVNRGCVDGVIRKMPAGGENGESGEPPVKKAMVDGKEKELATCETCGKKDVKSKFKKSKRFCSLSCAKRYARGAGRRSTSTDREGEKNSGGDADANESSTGENSSPSTEGENQSPANNEDNESAVNPLQWTVAEVCEFIRTLPGCADYVEDFAMQDIDGEALMLLKPDHLMSVMSMKLGPAVKIIAKIDTMRNGETNPAA